MFKSEYDKTFLSNDVNGALLCQIKHNSKCANVYKRKKINLRRTKKNNLLRPVKNHCMAKITDFFSVSVLLAFLTFTWAGLLLDNIVLAVVVAVTVTAVFVTIMVKLRGREEKPYRYDRLALELSVRGPSFLVEILKSILKNRVFESGFNFICLENVLILACFKFSNVSLADVPNIYSTAVKYNKTRVFLLARGVERKALRLLETYGIFVTVVKIKQIYRLLKKHNALPDLTKKKTFRVKDIPSLLLSKGNTKGLIFSGAVLIVTAFFTPLKIYYLVFGSVALLLAILTLTPLGKDNLGATWKLKDVFGGESTADTALDNLIEGKDNFEKNEENEENNQNDKIPPH